MKFREGWQYNVKAADHYGHLGALKDALARETKPLEVEGGKFVGYAREHGVLYVIFRHVTTEDDDDPSSYTFILKSAIFWARRVK